MRLRVVVLLLITSLSIGPAFASSVLDEFIPQSILTEVQQSGKYQNPVTFIVSGVANGVPDVVATKLSLQPGSVGSGESRGAWQDCLSTKDPICDLTKAGPSGSPNNSFFYGTSILPACTSEKEENCLESLEIAYGNEDFAKAKFLRQLQTEYTIKPEPETNFLGGSSISLWDDSNIKNSKSISYATNVSYGTTLQGGIFQINNISFSITPYVEENGNYRSPAYDVARKSYAYANYRNTREAWTENGRVGIRKQFPIDSKFRIKVRVSNDVSGWFQGRIKNPVVSIDEFSSKNNLVTIEGEPVKVPTFAYTKNSAQLSSKEYQWTQNNGGFGSGNGFISPGNSDQRDIFDYIESFRPLAEDKTVGYYTLWSVNSTSWGNDNSCLRDTKRVIGIVSTNAMGYDGNSPEYVNSTLNYKVAGMHYEPDGKKLVEGTYDLLMRSDAARCLYGFSKAPVQATISITGDSEQKVAVTSMTERNGWIKLSAYGFNFSENTIKVQLTQEQPPKVEAPKVEAPKVETNSREVVAAKPKVTAVKKKSITCTKGKLTKKISGANPKCPAGFKAK
jgi:7-cyano-7-deazaguanine synthase in queuosine biosynthesis